ncbi:MULTISPECIES: recombinase family protein [unclassified Streptomyces]|uniref:recombinase family protein n=1 Tax=unclassified Streptomyces TaxID=2593676 RepID=UPI0015A30618
MRGAESAAEGHRQGPGDRAAGHRGGNDAQRAYLRISDDDRDPITGELSREGVPRQLKDCRVVAAEMGGDIVKVYDDNDVSASDPFVVRKDFEALVKDLDAGVIDGFVFYHSERVARLAYDAARICQCYERKPKLVGRAAHDGTDLSTDNGRAMFVMQASSPKMRPRPSVLESADSRGGVTAAPVARQRGEPGHAR